MSFDVPATAYARFMGRYSEPLSELFLDAAGVQPGQRALDVGCGPGALTVRLVDRLGVDAVAAIDPSSAFVAALEARLPGVDVRIGKGESLPFADDGFDVTLAQLVVHFMTDPVAGLREMARVTRPDGVVAACVWDHAGGTGPLAVFWQAVHDLDPDFPGGVRPRRRPPRAPRRARSDRRTAGRRVHQPFGGRPVRHRGGVVGAPHPRGGPGRRLRIAPGPSRPHCAADSVCRAVADPAVPGARVGVVHAGAPVTSRTPRW